MDHKDKVADSKTGNAAIAMGGHYSKETLDADGNVVQRETWSATPPERDPSPQQPTVATGPATQIPGGGVLEIGAFIKNPGTEPISLDPATMAAALGRSTPAASNRQVTPTEKLAMLSMFYGEDGRFIPKDAFGQALDAGEQLVKVGALWDIGTKLIDYSQSVTTGAINSSTQTSQGAFNFAGNFEPPESDLSDPTAE